MTWFVALQGGGIPFAADPTPVTGQAVVTALVVVALLAGGAWLLRHRLPVARGRQIVTVETAVSLGERRSLVVVAIENRRLLLGMTPHQISLVTELTPGATVDRPTTSPSDGPGFSQTLRTVLGSGARS